VLSREAVERAYRANVAAANGSTPKPGDNNNDDDNDDDDDEAEDSAELSHCVVCSTRYNTCACFSGPSFLRRLPTAARNPLTAAAAQFVHEVLERALDAECIVCFESFCAGDSVTRLGCLCVYHRACLDAWHATGRQPTGCPVHRD
jgi:hypothetical protein